MSSARMKIGTLLALAVVSLLLCGIVAAELPELLSLTDNAANDFTVRNPSTLVKGGLSHANQPARLAETNSNTPGSTRVFSRVRLAEMAASPFTATLALHPVLRT